MADDNDDPSRTSDRSRERAVPAGRLARIGTFGRLVGGVAGGMAAEGARRLTSGERAPSPISLTLGTNLRFYNSRSCFIYKIIMIKSKPTPVFKFLKEFINTLQPCSHGLILFYY